MRLEAGKRSTSSRLLFILVLLAVISAVLFLLVLRPSLGMPSSASVVALPAYQETGAADQLLVWQGNGAAPGQHSGQNPGQIAWMSRAGEIAPLMEAPQQVSRLAACGDGAQSADRQYFAFFTGGDAGSLYLLKGKDAPARIADVEALACVGSGTFQFSPDSARLGYIAYEAGAAQSEFADGKLHILTPADGVEVFSAEQATAFDLTSEGAAFVSFYTNDKNEADEASVNWWDGAGSREIVTVKPLEESCKFTSAQVAAAPNSQLVVLLGHRCKKGDTRTSWQLYKVNGTDRSVSLVSSDFQAGSFAAFARTNNLWLSPDGARVYFTVPDGITANTVAIRMLTLADDSIKEVIPQQALMATYSGMPQAAPQLSPNGQWLAFVVTSPNNENTLQVLNLADPTVAPITVSAGSRGDVISSMAFTADSQRLILVAGGDKAADNSLFAVSLADGSNFRIVRGRFGSNLVVSPAGNEVALLNWQIPDDPKEPAFANTVLVGVDSGQITPVFSGADLVDGKVTNQRFATPLLWP